MRYFIVLFLNQRNGKTIKWICQKQMKDLQIGYGHILDVCRRWGWDRDPYNPGASQYKHWDTQISRGSMYT